MQVPRRALEARHAAFKRLAEELAAGCLESELQSQLISGEDEAFARIFRAVTHAEQRRYRTARTESRRAALIAPNDAVVALTAGVVLYASRDHHGGLSLIERALRSPRGGEAATELAWASADRLGWSLDARRLLLATIEAHPEQVRWRARAMELDTQNRHFESALAHGSKALALLPGSARLWLAQANLLARTQADELATSACIRAVSLSPDVPELRLEAASVMLEVGAFDDARRELTQVLAQDAHSSRARSQLSLLDLWGGDQSAAVRGAELTLELDPEAAAPQRVLGVVAYRAGDLTEARVRFEQAVARDPSDGESLTWLAELAWRAGERNRAEDLLTQASMRSSGFAPCVWVLRVLNNLESGRVRAEEILPLVREVVPEGAERLEAGDRTDALTILSELLRRLGNNRSTRLTQLRGGQLVRVGRSFGPRYASRWALELVRVDPQAALAELDRVVERFPQSSLPLAHRGELKLWLGDLSAARADLEAAIAVNPATRWAYIGLTGVDTLEGRLEQALATSARGIAAMNNTVGPAVYVYRGDALRRLGRYAEALEDLELAATNRSRVGAVVACALARGQAGNIPGETDLFRHLMDHAPGLLSDAALELGLEIWGDDPGSLPAAAERRELLEHALHMMRGNRSSTCASYLTERGEVRFVNPYAPGAKEHTARDLRELQRARGLLFSSLSFGLERQTVCRANRLSRKR